MSVPRAYPPAIQKLDGGASGSWSGRGEWKLVVHTTETRGMPGYTSGDFAPHLTYWPARNTWTQHYRTNRPAESVRTFDNDQIYQIEIIAYSNRPIADRYGGLWIGDISDAHLARLAEFVEWLRRNGIPIQSVWPGKRALSYSQANAPGFRYTPGQFYDWPGVLGHQHTPAPNTHWDPGAFPWERFIAKIGGNMADHPASSFGEFVNKHDIGEVPSWSPWDQYVAAGGSTVPKSGTWAYSRADIAWFWKKFIVPLQQQTAVQARELDDLDARITALESVPPGTVQLETETVEVVKKVRIL